MTTPMTKDEVLAVLDDVANGIHSPNEGDVTLAHHTLADFIRARATIAAWNVGAGDVVAWVSADTLTKLGKNAVAASLYGYKPWPRNNKRNHVALYTHPTPSPDTVGRLVRAAAPFATFNSSEPTITVRTPDVTELRAALSQLAQQGGESKDG